MPRSSIRRAALATLTLAVAGGAAHAATAPDTPMPPQPARLQRSGHAVHLHARDLAKQTPAPHVQRRVPPTLQETMYNLPPTRKARTDLQDAKTRTRTAQQQAAHTMAGADCSDVNQFAAYSGAALAQYIATLPDYECTYGLFSLNSSLAATIYSPGNMSAVVSRFAQEAAAYNASSMALVNLTLYLRAGYYLAGNNAGPTPSSSLTAPIRAAMRPLIEGTRLFSPNSAAPTTAGEVMTLITNMADEAYYLDDMKLLVQRYTDDVNGNGAATQLLGNTAAGGFTGVLTVFYRAHWDPNAASRVSTDPSFTQALNAFVVNNKRVLLNTSASYQLDQTATEAFRFLQYPALQSTVRPEVQNALASSSMTGADNAIWLAAATAVDNYDASNCSVYGTCDYKNQLAAAVLTNTYTCSPTIRIRSQAMTPSQLQQSCSMLSTEEGYFHTMMQTNRVPVANDNNTSLEVVVFNSYADYQKYSGAIFGNSTDNGGIYLEGEPDQPGNQARFIAYRADWLTDFQVWNLNHEYVHYLDGRFDMYGDFATETSQPDVWYIEGLAEYISKKNDDQPAIDAAKSGQYPLSTVFKNTYDMADYVNRAYNWGYMATRFMFERHRSDIDAILPLFRKGDYTGYESRMDAISTRYDAEFASWVQSATTAGQPPLPGNTTLPACANQSSHQLGQGCSIQGLSATGQAYAYIILPTGAKNLKLWTSGGTGDADLYVAKDRYPTTTSYDLKSATPGNNESVSLASPVAGHWYYIVLQAQQPFSGVAINASYE
jgi:microbial collagenase